METVVENATPLLLSAFLAITFLQSALDKVFNWNGNLSWLKSHFEKSPLKGMVPALFLILLITELAAGVLSVLGIVALAGGNGKDLAFWGGVVSCLALLMLLFGQRMAGDYDGARTIAIYFMPAVFLVFLLQ